MKRSSLRLALVFVSTLVLFGADPFQSKGFLSWPASAKMGELSSVAVGKSGHVYVLHRGEPGLLEFDENGRFLKGWGEGLFKVAHGIRVDARGSIWTTDNGNHVIREFSADGQLLRTLGEVNVPGAGKDHFRSPDDLVFNSKGEMLVADSGNGRIVRLAPNGTYLSEWGRKGSAPGEFHTPHGLAIDAQDRLYVADRNNNRVQVFSPEGKLISVWAGFGNPFGVLMMGRELLVSAAEDNKIFQLDPDGKVVTSWGGPSVLNRPHFMVSNRKGELLVAEVYGKRVQIFSRAAH